MYEVDFLPVEVNNGGSTKSGDAIAMRFTAPDRGEPAVVVIDGGFSSVGEELAEHVEAYYGSTKVDLVISTHPDSDHINGLIKILEMCEVRELMMHLPWKHDGRADQLGNYEKIVELYDLAVARGVQVTEPFTGEARFGGALNILGPSEEFYEAQLAEAVSSPEALSLSASGAFGAVATQVLKAGKRVLERVRSFFPAETLSDSDETSARNKMSVVTLVQADGARFLFTGDAGIPSLEGAVDQYESTIGSFESNPLELFQAPHHGSHRNLGPTILDRILGQEHSPYGSTNAVISSAKLSEKHPSPKVTNALGRRGARVAATEGRTICLSSPVRSGWSPVEPIPPLEEDE